MNDTKFPIITLRGDSQEIGFQHGRFLKDRIHSTVKWYRRILNREDKELDKIINHFKLLNCYS